MLDAALGPQALRAATDASGVAVSEGDGALTWAGLDDRVARLASGLAALGVKPGERVVWSGPNSTDVVVVIHALRAVGAVAVPMPHRLTAGEARHVLEDSGAVVAVVDAACGATVAGLLPSLRRLRHALVFGGTVAGLRSWEEVVALGTPSGVATPAGAGRTMFYTSGTSGRPKGAVRPRTEPAPRQAMLAELAFGDDEVHLVTGPLYHAGPHAFALLAHLTGGRLVVSRAFDPAAWVRLVARHRVTSAFVAPVHLKRIVALPDDLLSEADLSCLRTVIVNAAPVPYSLKEEVVARLGAGFLYEVYGATELGIVTVLRPEDQLRKPGSCGRPYGGIGIRIVGTDGADVPAGEVGEVFVRTDQAIDGYHGAVAPMAELAGGGGWKSVGDMGRLDAEGYLHICDRKTDVVITGGVNVYPAEVEAALHAHPDVADAAVIGVPDDAWGERVHAVVTPRPGRVLDPAGLDAFLAPRLAPFKRPRSWEVCAALPRTESGKLLRRALRGDR